MASIQVILTEKIDGLGAEADVVKVRGGYARNFLLPRGIALEATTGNLNRTANLKSKRLAREAAELEVAQQTAATLRKTVLKLELATGQGGKSFGSITAQDIANAAKEQANLTIDRHHIALEKPIKSAGEYAIEIKFHAGVEASISLVVTAKGDN